ncbi:hypothetical protein BGZ70_006048 [Mortierella alpina]|uniref:Galactose oxidase n=1 Tax=Mortierella alpina TaxID=64518 RepID=A0A9P6M464_MORAP|nr:hypothetical protein BGZ70_006048 [Mortierella alpina]
MKAIFSILAAFAVIATTAHADPAKPTIGHTATLIDNTVFIQGGSQAAGQATNAAYSIILGTGTPGGYKTATFLDITKLSNFQARDFHISMKTEGGIMVNCGTLDGTTTSCDMLHPIKYNSSVMASSSPPAVRGGMAVGISNARQQAYIVGGGTVGAPVSDMNVMTTTSDLKWRSGTPMGTALIYHTATFVEGSVNGLVVLGGQLQNGGVVALGTASVFSSTNSSWTTQPLTGTIPTGRYGHTAVNDGNGVIYVYGGVPSPNGAPMNDVYALDTATWAWKRIAVTAEARAFHASVLLPDNTILHTFGQGGPSVANALNTVALHDLKTNSWDASTPNFVVATESPNKPPDTSNNPQDPNFKHPGSNPGEVNGADGKKPTNNLGMILGIVVGCLFIIVLAGLFILRRRRSQNGPRRYSVGGGAGGKLGKNKTGDAHHKCEESDKTKLARSFTIREPADAYVRDDRDLEQSHHGGRYKSDGDSRHGNHHSSGSGGAPYYGDRRSSNGGTIIEYELTDTSGQAYGPGSVAERKRYVEEQQRQFMDEYDNIYAAGPPTPRSEQSSLPQLRVDHSPSMGSRSPRTPRTNYTRNDGYDEDIDSYYNYK